MELYSFSSVQFSHSGMSNSLWPHGLQHTRLPCPSPAPKACSNSCPSSRWSHSNHLILCHPLLLLWLLSFPASGFFPMSYVFTSGGQIIEASFSASVLPMNIQSWFALELTGLISWLQSMPVFRFLERWWSGFMLFALLSLVSRGSGKDDVHMDSQAGRG